MQRTILIALATAVVAAAIAAGATILLTDNENLSIATPPPTRTLLESVAPPTESASSTDDASTQPAPAPGRTDTAQTTGRVDSPANSVRSAKSVDCETESKMCSQPHGAHVEDGKLLAVPVGDPSPDYSGVPTISMDTEFRKKDKSKANDGDELHSIHVEVVVQNKTEKTFVFAKREIALAIYKDGKVFDTLVTTGEGFNMTPGGKMTATFDRPITSDGEYVWQAKTWYYEK